MVGFVYIVIGLLSCAIGFAFGYVFYENYSDDIGVESYRELEKKYNQEFASRVSIEAKYKTSESKRDTLEIQNRILEMEVERLKRLNIDLAAKANSNNNNSHENDWRYQQANAWAHDDWLRRARQRAEEEARKSQQYSWDDFRNTRSNNSTNTTQGLEFSMERIERAFGIKLPNTKEAINKGFRTAAKNNHPDKPNGSESKFKTVTRMKEQALMHHCTT